MTTQVPYNMLAADTRTALMLALCHRYYWQNVGVSLLVPGYQGAGGLIYADIPNPVPMRVAPQISLSGFSNTNCGNASVNTAGTIQSRFQAAITALGAGFSVFNATFSSEL